MKVFKFYDTYCEKCNNWYGAYFGPVQTTNQKEAITEMQKKGWKEKDGKTLCHRCE